MSPARVYVSKATAEYAAACIETIINETPFPSAAERRSLSELRGALRSLAGRRKVAEEKQAHPKPDRKTEKRAKRLSHNDETHAIRRTVFRRSGGVCECGCGRIVDWDRGHMDHFFGRKRVPQSDRNCWWLAAECDWAKTTNAPNAAHWLDLFVKHCERHGFSSEANRARLRLYSLTVSPKDMRRAERGEARAALSEKAEGVGRG